MEQTQILRPHFYFYFSCASSFTCDCHHPSICQTSTGNQTQNLNLFNALEPVQKQYASFANRLLHVSPQASSESFEGSGNERVGGVAESLLSWVCRLIY